MMDGHATEAGLDPISLPLDRFLSWAHVWFMARLDARGRRSFDMALSRPLPGADPDPDGDWSDEALADEWAAML